MNNTIETKENYQGLVEKLELLNLLSEASEKIQENCKISLKKLSTARAFADIDNKILDYSLKNINQEEDFLLKLINLETKRLRFKEQTTKCNSKKTKIKIST